MYCCFFSYRRVAISSLHSTRNNCVEGWLLSIFFSMEKSEEIWGKSICFALVTNFCIEFFLTWKIFFIKKKIYLLLFISHIYVIDDNNFFIHNEFTKYTWLSFNLIPHKAALIAIQICLNFKLFVSLWFIHYLIVINLKHF